MLVAANLRKRFALSDGGFFTALDDVSLDIPRGTFFTLLGPSGCGKTTTLRSIAGLEQPDSGRIEIDGRAVLDSARGIAVPAARREIGMVFQSYAIWPHMDVFENVAFPLRVGRRMQEADIRAKVRRALASVQMEEFERRPATRLSGGQQQRVAMARALVREPQLLLLDEPLSNLDAMLRETMRLELRSIQREFGITTVYVTHDQIEALAVSDVVAVMRNGKVVQQGDVRSIYNAPQSLFVAEFIGSTNLLPGKACARQAAGDDAGVELAFGKLRARACQTAGAGDAVVVSARPEAITLTVDPGAAGNAFGGRIVEQCFLGHMQESIVDVRGVRLRVWGKPDDRLRIGSDVHVRFDPRDCMVFAAADEARPPAVH